MIPMVDKGIPKGGRNIFRPIISENSTKIMG